MKHKKQKQKIFNINFKCRRSSDQKKMLDETIQKKIQLKILSKHEKNSF